MSQWCWTFNRSLSGLCTKANNKNDIKRLLMWAAGYADRPNLSSAVSDSVKYEVYTSAWRDYTDKLV